MGNLASALFRGVGRNFSATAEVSPYPFFFGRSTDQAGHLVEAECLSRCSAPLRQLADEQPGSLHGRSVNSAQRVKVKDADLRRRI